MLCTYSKERAILQKSTSFMCSRGKYCWLSLIFKVYQVLTLEDKYLFTTRDLSFPKMTSPHVPRTIGRIPHDPESDPGSTSKDQGLQHPLITTSVHTRILAEDIESDDDWCRYILKYPNEAVTFYNASHPVVCRLVPTLFEINMELPQSP
jgi:hypothetical protein